MKVLFVDQSGQMGGGELSILDVIKYSPFTSEMALFSDGPFRTALEEIGVPVHMLSAGSAGSVRREAGVGAVLSSVPALLGLRRELAGLARSADVIYANSQKAFLVSALARGKKQVLVWHLRDMLTAEHFSPLMRKAAVTAGNRSASVVVANSRATRDSFIEAGGRPEKSVVIYNGIDPAPYDAVHPEAADALRRQLGLEGKFVVGVFGRLTHWKGQHVVIDAVGAVPDAHLMIVGDALFGEQEYAQGLRTQVRERGLEERVHFLGFRRDIPALMKVADVVVHSSVAPEPFGRVIVEAMLSHRPVIATRAGGVVEIIDSQQTGILVTPGSVEELASAMARIRTDPALASSLAAAGDARARAVFSVEAVISQIGSLLAKLRGPVT